ncbi:unnamed protein product, partial [Rotaria magnacalcarata]
MSSINSQLAEINRSNNDVRTTQLNTNELYMNEQHQLGEQHQHHYFQPTMYEEDNDIEQREGLLRSLEPNPHMLRDFYQLIEFTRARSVQPSIQTNISIVSQLRNVVDLLTIMVVQLVLQ